MSNLKNKSIEIHAQAVKVEALIHSADNLVESVEHAGASHEDIDRFLTLFYMAVDAARELRAMTEDL